MTRQENRSPQVRMLVIVMAIIVATIAANAQNEGQLANHEHEVSGEKCFICDSSLRDKGRLWCKEHDRYENRCWLCHPELEEKGRLWCKEHSLYEDECFLCHPELGKEKTSDEATEQCKAHGIDAKDCHVCDSSLRDKGRLWCTEHARYEDRCWLCHPEMQDKDRPFCKEHHFYEDECSLCNPKRKKKVIKKSEGPSSSPVLFCNEHKVPEHQCGICQPQLAGSLEPGQSMKVRFASKHSTAKAGIRTAFPQENSSAPIIEAFCRVGYNENQLAHITPLAEGVIRHVLVDVGAQVNTGDVLAEIHSDEVAKAKTNFLSAVIDHEVKEAAYRREESLVQQNISAARDFQEAEAACKVAVLSKKTAQQRLLNFGFTQEEIIAIERDHDSSSILMVRAPFTGTIVARQAVMGELIEPGKALLTLANLSNMWLELSVLAEKAAFITSDLDVEAVIDGFSGLTAKGKLVWIDTSIDERSRMLKARAVVSNDERTLKAGMFGQARIAIGQSVETLRVPKDTVQMFERNPYLFVKLEDDLYDLRRVSLGDKSETTIDVISGIDVNEQVVVSGTFTMMSEFLKSRLGAGCVDD